MGFLGNKAAIDAVVLEIKKFKESPEGKAQEERLNSIFDPERRCCRNEISCYRKCIDNTSINTCYIQMCKHFEAREKFPDKWNIYSPIPKGYEKLYSEEYEKWKLENKDK